MSRKKIFLVLLAVSSMSLLLHQGGHIIWPVKDVRAGCQVPSSARPAGTKSKHTNIMFLKTHKTASSTMQNLLFRFAERHNLTVGLPLRNCDHQFCYPRTFSSRFVHPYSLPPHIITNHMRFNYAEVRRVMPNNTLYITILREPSSMFESLFAYYTQYCQSFKRVPNGSLQTFIATPRLYYRSHEKDSMYAHNTLTFDLGGDKDQLPSNRDYVEGFIAEIEKVFSLVMISEYFDESLVLLRHLLSWDLEDVLYINLNMRTPGSKRSLSEELPVKIRAWNAVDAQLYDHFNATLWRRLEALGLSCVAKEVQHLRSMRSKLVHGCFGGQRPKLRPAAQIKNEKLRPWQPSSNVSIMGYDLPLNASFLGMEPGEKSHSLCLKLILPEVQYSRLLLQSQSLRFRKNFPMRAPPHPQPEKAHQMWKAKRHAGTGGRAEGGGAHNLKRAPL